MKKKILVTGGAGFIGSHVCIALIDSGFDITVIDNFSNSFRGSIQGINKITGCDIKYEECDLLDIQTLKSFFKKNEFDAVIHLAGLKSVGESVLEPLKYFKNNVSGTLNLLEEMDKANIRNLIFSSSATVYGLPNNLPISETHDLSATSPYGQTKICIENILELLSRAELNWSIISLRYFNPIGAHPSSLIGEHPLGIPNNLMPYLLNVASKKIDRLKVFGGDYATKDGTGVRDYIHIMDLADAHVESLKYSFESKGFVPLNIGTGKGLSVLDLINCFEKTNNIKIPFDIIERRSGDVDEVYADVSMAEGLLKWKASRDVNMMCRDSWNWIRLNPDGYKY